jgi:hypothetical protein
MSLYGNPASKSVPTSLKGLVYSYFFDVRAWATGLATGYAIAGSLLVLGAVCNLAAVMVGMAALFHWIEVNYGTYRAFGIIGGGLILAGALCVVMGLRLIKQPKSRFPLAERQIAIAKRAVGAPALQRLNGASRSNLFSADPITEFLAGAAAVILIGWAAASRVERYRNRVHD